jgi:hypothetical protein
MSFGKKIAQNAIGLATPYVEDSACLDINVGINKKLARKLKTKPNYV